MTLGGFAMMQPNTIRDGAGIMLKALLADCDLDARLRSEHPEIWNAAWADLPYQPVQYSAAMLEYQGSYFRGAGWSFEDTSLVLMNDGRPCGLWPLGVGGADVARLTSSGGPVLAPLFVRDLSARTEKRICTRALDFAGAVTRLLGQTAFESEQPMPMGAGSRGVTEWHQQLLALGATLSARHDLYVDLTAPLSEVRANIRKSYRPLISSGLKMWDVAVLDSAGPRAEVWAQFRELHKEVSGRVTRSDESWQVQLRMIADNGAFLVYLRDTDDGRMVGGGLFQFTRDEGLYAVAAYDRALFDKPLGHVVQYRAIEELRAREVKWYRIGERHYPGDRPEPTAKQLAIASFKQGFASHTFCRYLFSHSPTATDS